MDNKQNEIISNKYKQLLGVEQTSQILKLFSDIENGKYLKSEVSSFQLNNLKYPIYLRSIKADMQSFVNTFIDAYLEKKTYLKETKYVIDAGANIGFTAVLFANWWPEAKIISIEADEANFELASKNCAPYSNITIIKAGLWNREVDLKIEAGQEDGFVVREIEKNITEISKVNLTKGISINYILNQYQFPHIDFLKMNIEGSEKEIFSLHYQNWLNKTNSMLIELHDGKNAGCSKAAFKAINDYDFAIAETATYGILLVKEDVYRKWYAKWYKEEIYNPNIDKGRFPNFYLDAENQ